MKILSKIFKIIKNIALIILAIFLTLLISIVAFVWLLYVSIFNHDRSTIGIVHGIDSYFLALAESIDKFGNCAFGGFFNAFFLETIFYSFGYNYETISQVIGWNNLFGGLNKKGTMLYNVLDDIETDHCELAVISGIVTSRLRLEKFEKLKEVNPIEWGKINSKVDSILLEKHEIRIDIDN